jgi:adenylyltransferase/sulfurtransferase
VDRYDRQKMINGWDQQLLGAARLLVVGAGTTGNEVIKNLVLLGIGNITIVDSDTVEVVNLSRSVLFRDGDVGRSKAEIAALRAHELNDGIQITGWNQDVVYDVGNLAYQAFDVAVLTVDNLEARMWVNRYCWLNETALVDTGVYGLFGNVFVMNPPRSACIECTWTPLAYQRLSERYSCLKLGLQPTEAKVPMVITSAATIGGIAAQECVRLLHDRALGRVRRAGVQYSYDGEVGTLFAWQAQRRDECPGHRVGFANIDLVKVEVSSESPVQDARRQVGEVTSSTIVELFHDKEIVYSQVCNVCLHEECIAPVLLGRYSRVVCPRCGSVATVPKDRSEELRDGFTLQELGVPANHLVRSVMAKDGQVSEIWFRVR